MVLCVNIRTEDDLRVRMYEYLSRPDNNQAPLVTYQEPNFSLFFASSHFCHGTYIGTRDNGFAR